MNRKSKERSTRAREGKRKWGDLGEKKEEQLKGHEGKLEKACDVSMSILKNAQAQMGKAITGSDMVVKEVKVACEMVEVATKKLESSPMHYKKQSKIGSKIRRKGRLHSPSVLKPPAKALSRTQLLVIVFVK